MATLLRITTQVGDLELPQGADFQFFITRQVHDLNSWETRNADFTSTLTIPATPINIAILNAASDVGGSAENVDNKIQCSIFLDGITVAPVAFLLSTRRTLLQNNTTFEVVIFYGNFNLFDTIAGDDISDLNWADLAILWDVTALRDAALNTTDLVFPICDWHTRNSTPVVNPPFSAPVTLEVNTCGFFLYVKEIMSRIVANAGFDLIIDPSVPSDYNLIALACPVTKFIDLEEGSAILSTTLKLDPEQVIIGATENITYQSTNNDPGAIFDHANNEWLIQSPDEYYFEAKGTYSYDPVRNQNDPSRIVLYQNMTELAFIDFENEENDVNFFISTTLNAVAGDILYVVAEAANNANRDAELTIHTLSGTTISTAGAIPDRVVQPSQHIPQIDQGAFISNMLKLFNLLLLTNDIESTVTLMSFDVLYTNKENDLSAALATGEAVVETDNYLGSLGQNSHLRWQEDNLLRRNANHVQNFPSQILNKTVDVITMDFSACDNSQLYFNSNDTFLKAKIPMSKVSRSRTGGVGDVRITTDAAGDFTIAGESIQFEVGDWFRMIEDSVGNNANYRVVQKASDTSGTLQTPIGTPWQMASDLFEVVSAESESFEPRLAIIRDDGGNPNNYAIMQGSSEDSGLFIAGSLTANWMDSLKMSEIADTYYKRIFDSLQTPQVIKARFNLAAIQVLNFDFTRPIYVDAFNAFYYCNKINKYKINSTTELELVRISALIDDSTPAAQGQFNNDFNNDFKINP